jgi:tripartite ATP-independent transporter DctP family solute receptor
MRARSADGNPVSLDHTGRSAVDNPVRSKERPSNVQAWATTRREFMAKAFVVGVSLPALSAVLDACGGQSSSTTTATMRIGVSFAPTDLQTQHLEQFKSTLAKETGGRLTVNIYPSGQLGNDATVVKAMQLGTVDGTISATSAMGTIAPSINILDLPYLFKSSTHFTTTMDGSVGKGLAKTLDEGGIHAFGYFWAGSRHIYNKGHVIQEPADLKGVKIRVLPSDVYIAVFKAFGAIPTPIAFPELYLALQTGTVTAGEGALGSMISAKLDEVIQHVSLTEHSVDPGLFSCSSIWWKKLPADLQQAVKKAANETLMGLRSDFAAGDNNYINKLKAEGKDVVTPDLAAFRSLALTVVADLKTKFGQEGAQIVDTVVKGA